MLNLDESTAGSSPYAAALWETLVFSELRKLAQQGQRQVNFWYSRDQRGREIDFVLEAGGRLNLLEMQMARTAQSQGRRASGYGA